MADPAKTQIEPGILQRLVQGLRYTFTGAWMGPSSPAQPVADKPSDQTAGRRFNYPVAYNINLTPKRNEGITFSELRGLADAYDLVRLCIETRKDQMCALEIDFRFRDKTKKGDDRRIDFLRDFFRFPDRENDWDTWLRMLLEDLLVIDAPTLYPRMTRGGEIYGFEPVDGATINRVIDGYGRTPVPPDPAYQQILHGMPAINYTKDEIIYRPRNLRTNKVYGFSPVEQIVTTVNIALRRQLHQLTYFTEGNVPNSLFSVPESWNPDDIRQFQEWWDSVTTGTSKNYGRFVPHGVNVIDTKQAAFGQNDHVMNEWLSRIVCYCFNVSPTQLVQTNNRATAENQLEIAEAEGIAPTKKWLKSLIDHLIHNYFGFNDLEMHYVEQKEIDPKVQAEIDQIYINLGVVDPEEVRNDLGLAPLTDEQRARIEDRRRASFPADQSISQQQQPISDSDENDGQSDDGKNKQSQAEKISGPLIGKLEVHMPPVHTGDTLIEAHFSDGSIKETKIAR
jgi:hypothetical protein